MEKQLDELRAKMEASTQRLLAFERELNVINPEEKTNILSARLLQLNTEWTNAQGDRVRKEAAFNSTKSGSLEAAQVSTQGEALKKLGEQYADAQVKFAEAKLHYGPNHPDYKKASGQVSEILLQLDKAKQNIAQRVEIEYRQAVNREAMLQNGVAQTKNEFDRLNSRSVEYQTLKREADADKKLYDELVRKIKEAGINASFQNSAIRIADIARPGLKPVFPDIKLNVFLAFLFSSLVAVGAAVLSDVLDKTIRDPEQVVRLLNCQVIGSLPTVKTWRGRIGPVSANGQENNALVRVGDSTDQSATGYGEAIRTLRNSILLTDFDRRMRSLLITSASPGEGKSTIAANLAATHAEQKQRTLLIDGDLRRPSVHRRFNITGAAGLSNVLVADLPWKQALIKSDQLPDLDILPAGPPSRRASDLIGRGLIEILEQASADYDLIVLDAPPMLGFAEPLQMATAVDGVIVVTRAGETNRQAVASVLSTLNRLRANVVGIVLNEVSKEMSDSYYYYGYYGKYYGEINADHRM
jgi:capsular exopolysaccharide synthesis family protein